MATQKVVLVTDDLGGGTGNHLLGMLQHWITHPEWQAELVSTVPSTSKVECPVPLSYLSPPKINRYPFAQVSRFRQLHSYLRRRQPTIVHTYFFWSIIIGRLLKHIGAVDKLVENREDSGFNWGWHEYQLLRLTRRLPDRVICVSNSVRDVVMRKEGVSGDRIEVIHNGIPEVQTSSSRESARKRLGIAQEQLVIGMVANLNREVKGGAYFVEAIPKVLNEIPAATFLVIGLNPGEELRRRAEELGVSRHLLFTGYRADVDELYPAMDLSVLTSLSEGLSITILESMQAGIPVVATNVGGNPELVCNGDTGFLVEPKNVSEFASKVITLLKDTELRKQFGFNAQHRVHEHFRISRTAEAYMNTYDSLSY